MYLSKDVLKDKLDFETRLFIRAPGIFLPTGCLLNEASPGFGHPWGSLPDKMDHPFKNIVWSQISVQLIPSDRATCEVVGLGLGSRRDSTNIDTGSGFCFAVPHTHDIHDSWNRVSH